MGVGLCIKIISMLKHISSGFDSLAQMHALWVQRQVSRGCVSVASVVAVASGRICFILYNYAFASLFLILSSHNMTSMVSGVLPCA